AEHQGVVERKDRDQQRNGQQQVSQPPGAAGGRPRCGSTSAPCRRPSSTLTGSLSSHWQGRHYSPPPSWPALLPGAVLVRAVGPGRLTLRFRPFLLVFAGALSTVAMRVVSMKLISPISRMSRNRSQATAAALPKSFWLPQATSYRYSTVVIQSLLGPPRPLASNVRTSSKICIPPIVAVITTKTMVARIWGMVTEKN